MTTPTRLGMPTSDKVVLFLGGPLVGLALGWALPRVAAWASDQPWVPFQGPLELVASWQQSWAPLVLLTVGAALGVAFALNAVHETLLAEVDDKALALTRLGRRREHARGDIGAVFLDGKQLVLLRPDSCELDREKSESRPATVADAFTAHDYPWYDGDPLADHYQLWVPDLPAVPSGVSALLAAREHALRKKAAEDIVALRRELGRQGYTVRDDGTRQYWRPRGDLPPAA